MRFAILILRDEIGRKREIVHEQRLPLQSIGHRLHGTNDSGGPRASRQRFVDAGFFPRFLHDRLIHAKPGADPAARKVTGIMLQADEHLRWKVVSGRFGL